MDFGLTGKIGKKSPENRKHLPKMGFFPIFLRFFLFLGRFFPDFPVRPKSIFEPFFPVCSYFWGDFSPIFLVRPKSIFEPFFPDFGRKPEIDFLPGRQDRNLRRQNPGPFLPFAQRLNKFKIALRDCNFQSGSEPPTKGLFMWGGGGILKVEIGIFNRD